jgi:nucleoside phosphorylase
VVLIAATAVEYDALRRALPGARVVKTGVALSRLSEDLGDCVLSCGLAGGLGDDLPTGTVLIPREVGRPGGGTLHCDDELVEMLAEGARSLGIEPVFDPLVTTPAIVSGSERAEWLRRGYAGVDMETGRIVARRVAAVRVILDTPLRELSQAWSNPARALLDPRNWPQAAWLAREAPRAAERCARVVAAAQGIRANFRITRQ